MTKFLSTADVKRITGFSASKIRHLIAVGKLPAVNTSAGSRPTYLIRESDLQEMLMPTNSSSQPRTERAPKRIDSEVDKVFG
ncbi:MAG: hypothetical protein Aurels2KO_48270 [Aureliella sp.]